jgi:hypothetical protein
MSRSTVSPPEPNRHPSSILLGNRRLLPNAVSQALQTTTASTRTSSGANDAVPGRGTSSTPTDQLRHSPDRHSRRRHHRILASTARSATSHLSNWRPPTGQTPRSTTTLTTESSPRQEPTQRASTDVGAIHPVQASCRAQRHGCPHHRRAGRAVSVSRATVYRRIHREPPAPMIRSDRSLIHPCTSRGRTTPTMLDPGRRYMPPLLAVRSRPSGGNG